MIAVKTWLPIEELDDVAQTQIDAVRNHPYSIKHVAILPDAHGGYGVPIGCAWVTKNAIVPNAVGVDIGCGMTVDAVVGDFPLDEKLWKQWAERVRELVPVGNGSKGNRATPIKHYWTNGVIPNTILERHKDFNERSEYQIGTLGGGNHFMEALTDDDGNLFFMVHSGSRASGANMAQYFHELAIEQSKGKHIQKDLSVLIRHTQEYNEYLRLLYMLRSYAKRNREEMLKHMKTAYHDIFRGTPEYVAFSQCKGFFWRSCDAVHNFAYENMDEVVHRKGVQSANANELGVIPGSMGTPTYLIRGKGNEESHKSASHGSGRKLGRGAAKRELDVEDFKKALANTYTTASDRHLDESPMAYKPIEQVIDRQADLLSIERIIRPIITIKA